MRILVTGLGKPVQVEIDQDGTLLQAKESIAHAVGVDASELHVAGLSLDSDESVSSSDLVHRHAVDVYVSAGAGLPLALDKNNPKGSPGTGEPPEKLQPAHLPWRWFKPLGSLDWHGVRRGLQVYEEVFAPCHSLSVMSFRLMQDFMTREDALEFASRFEVVDPSPDEEGKAVVRPAGFADFFPRPYPNQEAAKFSNGGAAPPDLQSIIFGRHHGHDYVFSLLTGYTKPPCFGKKGSDAVFWNPYMAGGFIAMPPPLSDGMLEYGDGTPCTTYQMAKDVVAFLQYCSFVQIDWHKLMYWKVLTATVLTTGFAAFMASFWDIKTKYSQRWWQPALRLIKP